MSPLGLALVVASFAAAAAAVVCSHKCDIKIEGHRQQDEQDKKGEVKRTCCPSAWHLGRNGESQSLCNYKSRCVKVRKNIVWDNGR